MSESAINSADFSKKLADKVAAKIAAAASPSSNKKPADKAVKPQSSNKNTRNERQKSGNNTRDNKNKNFEKKSNVKTKPVNDKDPDLKKEVGDLIDSLGFNEPKPSIKKDINKKVSGKKNKSEQQPRNQTQDSNPKVKTEKGDRKNKKDTLDQSGKSGKKADSEKPKKSHFEKPKGGALKDIDDIVTSLENTLDDDASLPQLSNDFHRKNLPVFEPQTEWYNITTANDGSKISFPSETPDIPLSPSRIASLHSQAKTLLGRENELFIHEGNKSSSQKTFLSQLLTGGTLSDKISAYTLLVQESPLHSIKYFNALLSLCRKKSRGNALHAIAALKDMFVNGVLPDRKLKYFKNQPLSNKVSTEVLVLWAFEDWLKQFFFSLVQILEILSHDTVTYVRTSTVDHILDLLKSKPEQEANLLRLGVNKLGDKDKQVASRVSYQILKIEELHPAMNGIIASSVSELIFRPGSEYHARYYSIITLNQTILTHKNKNVANTLIRTYLSLFELLLNESNNDKGKSVVEDVKPQKKQRHKHRVKGQKARQTPVKTSEAAKEEEFDKLISAILTGMNRAYPFSDLPKDVFENHMNTIYRVTHSANFNTGVQALILLFQMSQAKESLSDRFYRTLYESLLDSRLAVSSKLRLYLNLMFKALKQDTNKDRVKAFTKRLIQVANHWVNIGVIAGVVYLVSELKKADPAIMKSMVDDSPAFAALEESIKEQEKNDTTEELNEGDQGVENSEEEILDKYDGRKRDPVHANASNTKIWEILPLLQHFHPTVAFYSQHYLGLAPEGAAKPIQPDLSLYSLTHFLDRFVYRNPKQKIASRGTSIMQPLAGSDPTGLIFTASGNFGLESAESGISQIPVNTADWKNMKVDNVDAGDRFFYNYFNMVQQNRKEGKSKKSSETEDADLDSEEAEQEIWKALVNSNPSIEEEDEDSDINLSMADMGSDDDDDDDDEDELAALEGLDDDEDDEDDDDDDDDDDEDDAKFIRELDNEDDALGSDEEVALGDDIEAQFEQALAEGKTNKRPLEEEDTLESAKDKFKKARRTEKKEQRKKLKELPLYASAEDYAQYLSD